MLTAIIYKNIPIILTLISLNTKPPLIWYAFSFTLEWPDVIIHIQYLITFRQFILTSINSKLLVGDYIQIENNKKILQVTLLNFKENAEFF